MQQMHLYISDIIDAPNKEPIAPYNEPKWMQDLKVDMN